MHVEDDVLGAPTRPESGIGRPKSGTHALARFRAPAVESHKIKALDRRELARFVRAS